MSIASVSHGFVFGLSSTVNDNIFYIEENTILYPAGSNVVISNVEQKSQRFVPVSDISNLISCLTVAPDKHVFAVAQKSSGEPSIHVYDLHTYRKRRKLTASIPQPQAEFVSMAFSVDSKYLVAQVGKPDWTLHYYPWEKGKPLATVVSTPSPDQPVYQVSINPFDNMELCVTGKEFATIYRLIEGVLKPIKIELPPLDYVKHCWVTIDRLIIGARTGEMFLIDNGQVLQKEQFGGEGSNSTISCIQATKRGFAIGGTGGLVSIYNFLVLEQGNFTLHQNMTLPDNQLIVTGLASTTGEDTLLVEVNTNLVYKVIISPHNPTKVQTVEEAKFEVFMEAFHYGAITSLDVCIRKPIVVTISSDKSIRFWNYLTGSCELVKFFLEEPQSISLHPSGLYILVGFHDKLKLMNILMDDLRLVREFNIRSCKECRFSNGGHIFAAAHGNIVQIFSTWTFENIENLKGHNGKVKSLYWTPDDGCLVSSGSDGAVYTWNMRTMKREHEHILKTCGYFDAVCSPSGRTMYAVGTDRMVKEITESTVTKEFESNQVMTQIALSNSGKMLFVGTQAGTIRALRFPFGDQHDFQEHQAHSAPVTKIKVSYDDQYLFSVGEDGCIYMFRLTDKDDRGMKKDKVSVFADEILITKSDLEEKTVLTAEIQRQLKLEHEYQLRLKDMNFNEKLKEITETFSQEIEVLKVSTTVLRTEKEKEDVKHQEQIQNLRSRHVGELHELDIKYNGELMAEYEKYHLQQGKAAALQEKWQKQMRDFENATQKALSELQSIAESRLNAKSVDIQRLYDELKEQEKEFEEMNNQNQQDIDTEIQMATLRYEKRLRIEREEGARLKGENGIMRKKFNTLNKDIEDNRSEIQRMKENAKKLEAVITLLEKDILQLRKEMSDRDELIQDKERKVYDLKKRNQELEKYKFVLDYRIKELKEQVEPRENHINEMNGVIENINDDLKLLNKEQAKYEEQIATLKKALAESKVMVVKEHRKVQNIVRYTNSFRKDLEDVIRYFQDTDLLRKSMENFYSKYSRGSASYEPDVETEVKSEYLAHQEKLKGTISQLRKMSDGRLLTYRAETAHAMTDNQLLIREINQMRQLSKFNANRKMVKPKKQSEPPTPSTQAPLLPRISTV
ncbi:Cilia- and flagella-associated protein 57 [Boothiomyces sp. JEL0838]|nr:Cilia- and flagella-associated protein 57 [Boothiomyces sp. JEL0838]